MQDTEAQEFLLEILKAAEQGKSAEFRLITSWYGFRNTQRDYRAAKLIIKMLKEASTNLFKSYCKEASTGSADFTQLLAYSQILDIKAFYEKDLDTLKRMLDEYDEYLGKGHFWFSFLGGERDIWNIH